MSAKKTTKTTAAKKPAAEKASRTPASTKKPKADGKMSALDAAAKVLAESGDPMTTREMIEAMAARGYWTSRAGPTPDRTLYSALLRELNTKDKDARFVKTERGKFATKKQARSKMDTRPFTHDDFADAAESAERGEAWPQASALWIRAAQVCRDVEQRNRYLDAAAKCDREVDIDKLLAGVARRELRVPTLAVRGSDSLDFHDVGVIALRRALRLAYRAGCNAAN